MSEMKKRLPFSWSELSRELTRRHVYTVVATYAVVSWILLQIGEVTFGTASFARMGHVSTDRAGHPRLSDRRSSLLVF